MKRHNLTAEYGTTGQRRDALRVLYGQAKADPFTRSELEGISDELRRDLERGNVTDVKGAEYDLELLEDFLEELAKQTAEDVDSPDDEDEDFEFA